MDVGRQGRGRQDEASRVPSAVRIPQHALLPQVPDRAFDEEGRGYVEATKLREALITKGTPFREKEIEAFMEVAKDDETGRIYYEDYVALLSAESNA